jgi:outer membrane protein OmpA-like peptidoglycan-associated protein
MEEPDSRKPKKKFLTLLMEIIVLLCVVAVSGTLGWFIGHGEVKNVRAVTRQFEGERQRAAELRAERADLRERIRELEEGSDKNQETDVDRLIARKESQWNRKLNQVRIEAEVEKVKRVEELEREVRLLKMDQRMKEQMAQGDDSEVPSGVAEGLTPRARQVCAEMLDWEGLDPEAQEAQRARLKAELGARSLVRVKFGSGSAHVGSDDLDALRIALADTKDYALILAVGFADTGGDEELNRELGSLRARNTADSLQGLIRRGQMVESVYLGETSRFGPKAENRVVEVWELER